MRLTTKLALLVVVLALVAGFVVVAPPVRAQGEATLFVVNAATWPVFIYVDGEPYCYVDEADAKDTSCRGKVSPGKHTFEALVGSEVIATQKVTLEPNTVFIWTVLEKKQ